MITLPYAMAYTLLCGYGFPVQDIEKAADIIDRIPAQDVTGGHDPFMEVIENFATLYEADSEQAFAYLNICAG